MLLDRRYDVQRELGLYEFEIRAATRRMLRPGDVALDIGCGDGYEALGWATRGVTVHAYDPSEEAISRFRRNLDLNPELGERISIRAHSFPGDDPIPRADFAKIDVDGTEDHVLEHLLDVPRLIIETHSSRLERDCVDLLQRGGYTVEIIPHAWWRRFYPEWRPGEHNRWLAAERS